MAGMCWRVLLKVILEVDQVRKIPVKRLELNLLIHFGQIFDDELIRTLQGQIAGLKERSHASKRKT